MSLDEHAVTTYQAARAQSRAAERRVILDAAGSLLAHEGPGALTMRRLARDLGCSTQVLYTMFHNKDGIVDALYLEGFDRLRVALGAIAPADDPRDTLRAIAWAYRANALANPTYYQVMFTHAVPGFTPPEASLRRSHRSFAVLQAAVERCMATGWFVGGDAAAVADTLWAMVHGMVSLELAGYFPDPDHARQRFALMLGAVEEGLLQGTRTGATSRPPPEEMEV